MYKVKLEHIFQYLYCVSHLTVCAFNVYNFVLPTLPGLLLTIETKTHTLLLFNPINTL